MHTETTEDNRAFDDLLATLEEMEDRETSNPYERLRFLGAPAHLCVDLSDADQHWVEHTCTSDECGTCPTCVAYVAAGGVL